MVHGVTAAKFVDLNLTGWRGSVFYVFLIALGLAGNYFKYPLFLEIDFLFGSIFAFLALQLFGTTRGILAGVLIASVTYYNWGHPYAILIMSAELAFVAVLTRRFNISMVLADALYWLLVGIPLAYLFYYCLMDVPFGTTTVTMAKQAVNGITNILLARIIFLCVGFRLKRYQTSLQEILHICMVFCVAMPMLFLIVIDSRSNFVKVENQIRTGLAQEARNIKQRLGVWIEDRSNALAVLTHTKPQDMQAALDLIRAADANFLRIGALDGNAVSLRYSPLVDEFGKSNLQLDFSNRPYLPALKANLKPMLSELVVSRQGQPEPIVVLLHPMLRDGRYDGYIAGVLSLSQIREHLGNVTESQTLRYTLLDKNNNVILTNRNDQVIMTPFSRGKGELIALGSNTFRWGPHLPINTPFYQRFKHSFYSNETTLGELGEWKLVLEQAMGPVQTALGETYTNRLFLLLLLLLIGTAIAEVVSRQIAQTFIRLRDLTVDLPRKLAAGKQVDWPQSRMLETSKLIDNFQAMADSLQVEFAETQQLNTSLEQRMQERSLALENLNNDFIALLDNTTDFISFKDAQLNWRFCSQPFAKMAGRSSWRELIGKRNADVFTGTLGQTIEDEEKYVLDKGVPVLAKTVSFTDVFGNPGWLSINKWPLFDNDGSVIGIFAINRDVTQQKEADDRIRNLAFYDALTQLPNRRLLIEQLEQALLAFARSGREGALLLIDLDHFKDLNDTLGHSLGDLLLQQVALRLVQCVRTKDTVARIGGDEFLVMLEDLSPGLEDATIQAHDMAEKILAALNQPYQLENQAYLSTPSIGVTLFSNKLDTVEDLLKRADLAMYEAKAAGRNTMRFFDPKMQLTVNARAMLEHELRRGVAENQLVLYYQSQIGGQGRIIGAEALVRWNHPRLGLLPPNAFIPLAEETRLILPLGLWVLETACAQLLDWSHSPATAHLTLAVNVSARQFHMPDFVAQVQGVLARSGANPQRLKLEMTESLLINDMRKVIDKMLALKTLGVGLSLDDFGTGYSSLSYLKAMPLDQLKIDKSFVNDIATDTNDVAIIEAIISLGRALGITVIAEGVETEAQQEFLARLGCHIYQGYLFGRPVPIVAFAQQLAADAAALPDPPDRNTPEN